jgi:hypothetical protein
VVEGNRLALAAWQVKVTGTWSATPSRRPKPQIQGSGNGTAEAVRSQPILKHALGLPSRLPDRELALLPPKGSRRKFNSSQLKTSR